MSAQDSIPAGFCQCGCGEQTSICRWTNTKRGQFRGEPNDYVRGHNPRRSVQYLEEDRGYETPCWIWQMVCDDSGHGRLGVGLGVARLAHRVYYERAFGAVSSDMHLHHKCEVPSCVNPAHLEPLTPGDHRKEHSHLNWDDVRQIRRDRALGVPAKVLGERYGTSEQNVIGIVKGETWKES